MRANEISTDGTEYAYRWRQWSTPVRVRIIEKTMVTGGPYAADVSGWLVEVIEQPHNGLQFTVGKQFKAKSRQIDSTWSAHLFAKKASDEQRARQEALKDQVAAANSIALAELQAFYTERGLDTTNLSTGGMRFTAVQLLALVKTIATHR